VSEVNVTRLRAARGLIKDYQRACAQPGTDHKVWANRLAAALSSITALAADTTALNDVMAEIFEEILHEQAAIRREGEHAGALAVLLN
jgi:hypothetical protein